MREHAGAEAWRSLSVAGEIAGARLCKVPEGLLPYLAR